MYSNVPRIPFAHSLHYLHHQNPASSFSGSSFLEHPHHARSLSWRSLVYRTARMPRRNAAYIKNENEGGALISDLMAQNNVPHLARKGDDGRCRRRVRGGGRLSRERRARDRGGQSKGKAPHVINLSYRWMWVSTRHRARERAKGKLHALSTYHIAGCGCQRGQRQTPRS